MVDKKINFYFDGRGWQIRPGEESYCDFLDREIVYRKKEDIPHELFHLFLRPLLLDRDEEEFLVRYLENQLQKLVLENLHQVDMLKKLFL